MHSQVSVNVNIGSPPLWGPSGYSNIDYYLMFRPIMILGPRNLFILSGKLGLIKVFTGTIQNYYDLYNGLQSGLNDYHGKTPYTHYKQHKVKYYKGYKEATGL
jgi:hypothetical protein